jgi:hypothetical protein
VSRFDAHKELNQSVKASVEVCDRVRARRNFGIDKEVYLLLIGAISFVFSF